MTVVAWDGKSIAADSLACRGDIKQQTTKLYRLYLPMPFEDLNIGEVVMGWTGDAYAGHAFRSWVANGLELEKFPAMPDDRGNRLIIVQAGKRPVYFESGPFPITIEEKCMAWGSGAEFAIGAMLAGASARQAVQIACEACASCGLPVLEFELIGRKELEEHDRHSS